MFCLVCWCTECVCVCHCVCVCVYVCVCAPWCMFVHYVSALMYVSIYCVMYCLFSYVYEGEGGCMQSRCERHGCGERRACLFTRVLACMHAVILICWISFVCESIFVYIFFYVLSSVLYLCCLLCWSIVCVFVLWVYVPMSCGSDVHVTNITLWVSVCSCGCFFVLPCSVCICLRLRLIHVLHVSGRPPHTDDRGEVASQV